MTAKQLARSPFAPRCAPTQKPAATSTRRVGHDREAACEQPFRAQVRSHTKPMPLRPVGHDRETACTQLPGRQTSTSTETAACLISSPSSQP